MTERLLQYIWQFQYFNKNELETTNGEQLDILYPGMFNNNQGPDFLEARIRIDKNIWIGNVELHTKASDWHRHEHAKDPNYKNIILHVTWQDDDEHPCHEIPTLLLADRVPKVLLQQYAQWMQTAPGLPCSPHFHCIEEIIWITWKERLLVERLQRKSRAVIGMFNENNSWEEISWWMIARNFGLPVNTEAFEEIARAIPFNVLLQHRRRLTDIENALAECASTITQSLHFLRMRPAAFPNARLQQLAGLIYRYGDFWPLVMHAQNIKQLKAVFQDNIIINAIVPLITAYGHFYRQEEHIQKAMDYLLQVSAEKNSITRSFTSLGVTNKNAADSQALIELKKEYCDKRRCLDCAIGNAILKKNRR